MAEVQRQKKRDAARTRALILDAAFDTFCEHGYGMASTREIARRANVTLSLINRYFGTKAELFEEVMLDGLNKYRIFPNDPKNFGLEMVDMVKGDANPQLTGMMVLSLADPEAREVVHRVTRHLVLRPLVEWLGPPDATVRALAILTLLNGYNLQTLNVPAYAVPEGLSDWLATQLQAIVDNRYADASPAQR